MPIMKLCTNDLTQQKQSNETSTVKSISRTKETEPQNIAGSNCVPEHKIVLVKFKISIRL